MRDIFSKPMTDVQLMNLAKKRIMILNTFKRHGLIYGVAVIVAAVACIFLNIGYFWLIAIMFAWGLIVAFHGIIINIALSDVRPLVSDEYYRLKGIAMIIEKTDGGITSDKDNRS